MDRFDRLDCIFFMNALQMAGVFLWRGKKGDPRRRRHPQFTFCRLADGILFSL